MPTRLRVTVTDARGRPAAAGGLARWLAATAPRTASGDVTVVLVPDARIRRLNRHFRGIDAATDVLSFPIETSLASSGAPRLLGDIVIATGVARRQAREAGQTFEAELRVLALHGLLHLLGYDHERNGVRMARMERRLRSKGGLRAGLIERAHRVRRS
jgi:probable rRNA maturation factor